MLRHLLPALAALCVVVCAKAQIITTSPAVVQTDSRNIVITYHADQGNKGLMGLDGSSKVYAHTGVITSQSTSSGDWKHAPTWGDNSSKYELTYVSANTWQLTIPDITTYYGLTAEEEVKALMFVFRNSTGSLEGKTANGGDIAVEVYPPGFQVVLTSDNDSQTINSSTPINFTVNTSEKANITLSVSGVSTPLGTASSATSLTASHAFTEVGSYTITATATPTSGGSAKSASITLVKLGASVQADYPGGMPRMGTVTNADGSVTFCIAAPGKQSAVLVPSWRDYTVDADLQMKYQDYEGNRYFWTTVSGLDNSTYYPYYYLIDGTYSVSDPYTHMILDPWSDKYIAEDVYPGLPQYPVGQVPDGTILAVYKGDIDSYNWEVTDFKGVDPSELIIYELLIRDFTGEEGEANGSGTVQGVIAKLDYLQSLGINAIELLPIMEFNGNNSWGYNTNFYFAPDKAYGTPNDYRLLIDECHKRGIAVILDIVFNQSDGQHPWYVMYDIHENPFYNAVAPHAYSVLNDWKQEHPLVRRQEDDAVRFWLEAYNVDGFRFDLVKGLGDSNSYNASYDAATNSYSGVTDAKTNAYNASRITNMARIHAAMNEVNPNAYFINEDLAGTEEENALANDGDLNWANINSAAINFALTTISASDMSRLYAPADYDRTWGSTVSYIESHDEERIAYAVSSYATPSGTISTAIKKILAVRDSRALLTRRLGTEAAMLLLTPGAHMIWQFQEFAADQTTKNSDGNDTSPKTVVWSYLDDPNNAGLKDTYASLIALRSANPELFTSTASATVNLNYGTGNTGSVVLTAGDRELILLVRGEMSTVTGSYPNLTVRDSESTIAVPLTLNAADYSVVAQSYDTTPAYDPATKTVKLRPGAFVVLATNNVNADISDITADPADTPRVYATENGDIRIIGSYTSASTYDIQGRAVGMTSLSQGIYIVSVDGARYKVIVP